MSDKFDNEDQYTVVMNARVRHWHGSPTQDGKVNSYCPYRGALHDNNTDVGVKYREKISYLLSRLPEGTIVDIVIKARQAENVDENDVWELKSPHTYEHR